MKIGLGNVLRAKKDDDDDDDDLGWDSRHGMEDDSGSRSEKGEGGGGLQVEVRWCGVEVSSLVLLDEESDGVVGTMDEEAVQMDSLQVKKSEPSSVVDKAGSMISIVCEWWWGSVYGKEGREGRTLEIVYSSEYHYFW